MRRLRYGVAMSLDGYIAGLKGEFDWIPFDPEIDFSATYDRFDTFVMGRKTFEVTNQSHSYEGGAYPGTNIQKVVVSRTLRASDYPGVTIINANVAEAITALKSRPGKDIWLFGGGNLFQSLLGMGLVDCVEVAIVPVLLGAGIPFLPSLAAKASLSLESHRVYKKSGIVSLEYTVKSRSLVTCES
jgi:dihydrofolate reductase